MLLLVWRYRLPSFFRAEIPNLSLFWLRTYFQNGLLFSFSFPFAKSHYIFPFCLFQYSSCSLLGTFMMHLVFVCPWFLGFIVKMMVPSTFPLQIRPGADRGGFILVRLSLLNTCLSSMSLRWSSMSLWFSWMLSSCNSSWNLLANALVSAVMLFQSAHFHLWLLQELFLVVLARTWSLWRVTIKLQFNWQPWWHAPICYGLIHNLIMDRITNNDGYPWLYLIGLWISMYGYP